MDYTIVLRTPALACCISDDYCYAVYPDPLRLVKLDITTGFQANVLSLSENSLQISGNRLRIQIFENILILYSTSAILCFVDIEAWEHKYITECRGKKPYIIDYVLLDDNQLIFSTLSHSNIYIINLNALTETGSSRKPIKLKLPSRVRVFELKKMKESSILLGCCSDGLIRLWNLSTYTEDLPMFEYEKKISKKTLSSFLKSRPPSVLCMDFNEKSDRLACGDVTGGLKIWNTQDISQ